MTCNVLMETLNPAHSLTLDLLLLKIMEVVMTATGVGNGDMQGI